VSALGPYELIDRFAIGGVAEIYRARDTRNGEIVVIKRLRPDQTITPEIERGFVREMEVALQSTHKNLVRGYELGRHGDIRYGVMEYVDGQDLESILYRARVNRISIPPGFSTFIISEILDGLEFAQGITDATGRVLGLVHRDLAPKNIFVRYDGQVRIGDFGLSLASRLEKPEGIVGTPGYLSPEQARGEPLDVRSDLFAVGCMLYDLITGMRAFETTQRSETGILKIHVAAKPRPLGPSVPPLVGAVITKALARHANDRYPSARAMQLALKDAEFPPDELAAPLGIATLVRRLFSDEFKRTRLTGNPLPFLSS
jgi:serine/threonine-protein kinase